MRAVIFVTTLIHYLTPQQTVCGFYPNKVSLRCMHNLLQVKTIIYKIVPLTELLGVIMT